MTRIETSGLYPCAKNALPGGEADQAPDLLERAAAVGSRDHLRHHHPYGARLQQLDAAQAARARAEP